MGLWKNIQRLARAGSVQGVVEPGPTDVVTPLQGVQIVDDITAAVPPIPLSVYRVSLWAPAAAAGDRTGFVITPAPSGTYVRWTTPSGTGGAGIEDISVFTVPIGSWTWDSAAAGTQATFLYDDQAPAPRATFGYGGATASPYISQGAAFEGFADGVDRGMPFLLRGRDLVMIHSTQNAQIALNYEMQDIPG